MFQNPEWCSSQTSPKGCLNNCMTMHVVCTEHRRLKHLSAEIRGRSLFVLTVRMFKSLEHDISQSLSFTPKEAVLLFTLFLILMSTLEPNMLFNLMQLCVNRFVWNHNCDRTQMWICGLGYSFGYSENELKRHRYDSMEHSYFICLKARRGAEGLAGIRLPALTQRNSRWAMCWNGCKEDRWKGRMR